MIVEYRDDGGVVVRHVGVLRAEDVMALNKKLYGTLESTRRIEYQLRDLRATTEVQISTKQLKRLARQDAKAVTIKPNMLIAMVGGRDLTYGLSRMWQALAGSGQSNARVFREMAAAEDWIEERMAARRIKARLARQTATGARSPKRGDDSLW